METTINYYEPVVRLQTTTFGVATEALFGHANFNTS